MASKKVPTIHQLGTIQNPNKFGIQASTVFGFPLYLHLNRLCQGKIYVVLCPGLIWDVHDHNINEKSIFVTARKLVMEQKVKNNNLTKIISFLHHTAKKETKKSF